MSNKQEQLEHLQNELDFYSSPENLDQEYLIDLQEQIIILEASLKFI